MRRPVNQWRAHLYTEGRVPGPNISGPSLVIGSQAQALLDLGFEAEVVVLRTRHHHPAQPSAHFSDVPHTFLDCVKVGAPSYARGAYWIGWPRDLAWRQLYPARQLLIREVKARIRRDPKSLHLFNYLAVANVIPSLPTRFAIYTALDIESDLVARSLTLDQRVEMRGAKGWERRRLNRMRWVESEAARCSGLVLCVSESEARQIRDEWNVPHAAYLPISIPFAEMPPPVGRWMPDGVLRLVHFGLVDHLPTYLSLEVLLTQVLPLLGPEALSRLQLEVVGKFAPESPRNRRLLEMARPYPQVKFSGFVEDIRAAYSRSDLQVIAATEATGLRTRIIESWAYGLSVLSTTVGAGGVEGLDPGRNIMIADDPREFAGHLTAFLLHPGRLSEIAAAARQTYDARYSRDQVAATLRELLNRHFGADVPAAP